MAKRKRELYLRSASCEYNQRHEQHQEAEESEYHRGRRPCSETGGYQYCWPVDVHRRRGERSIDGRAGREHRRREGTRSRSLGNGQLGERRVARQTEGREGSHPVGQNWLVGTRPARAPHVGGKTEHDRQGLVAVETVDGGESVHCLCV